jgi:hypothetical protein
MRQETTGCIRKMRNSNGQSYTAHLCLQPVSPVIAVLAAKPSSAALGSPPTCEISNPRETEGHRGGSAGCSRTGVAASRRILFQYSAQYHACAARIRIQEPVAGNPGAPAAILPPRPVRRGINRAVSALITREYDVNPEEAGTVKQGFA